VLTPDSISQHTRPTPTAFDRAYAGATAPQASSQSAIDAAAFDQAYAAGTPPWDIGTPQPAIVRLCETGGITGRVLDLGCGTGANAVFLAQHGLDVLGLDASSIAIQRARARAAEQRVTTVRFVVGDARQLASLGEPFDTVLDCGLWHTLSDADRAQVLAGVHAVLRPGGSYVLMCFSQHAVARGPRRSTEAGLREQFRGVWQVEAITRAQFRLTESWASPEAQARDPEDMGASAWLAHIRRL
jgi:SAM-dependent methyltransferase